MLALANHLPRVRVPWVSIGNWPTPVTELALDGRPVWVKHEGDAHPQYGGNKVRTLEPWFGHAQARGARRIWAIGAYGSNHAVATVAHAARAGLDAAAMVFPQPASEWAVENCGALVASGCELMRLASVVSVPLSAWRVSRRERDAVVMPPGGATPVGTIGALSGALELALQIERGDAPPPRRIVVGVGSTCTISGLVAGLSLAHAIGAWRWPVPIVHGVRVTPWPVTSPTLIADLAVRTLARIDRLGGPRVATSRRELLTRFVVDGNEIGQGYGRLTQRGDVATRTFAEAAVSSTIGLANAAARLDGVYSAKAAAALLRLHRGGVGPLLFWASKSRALLPSPALDAVRASHPALVRWLQR